ncbi:DUF4209 domain-containing protein [Vibrio sp. T187]|uniref:DUF4209 domain-containing protein n=1 Tax=Vibrio TaxID=662 RepID=UPI0010C9735F|nr:MULTISPECIES: DUF4209 domain-containing protein [Vibrio]MBW3698056.1 DUF4209 domain-containing protein [Vibrio sp. T187]
MPTAIIHPESTDSFDWSIVNNDVIATGKSHLLEKHLRNNLKEQHKLILETIIEISSARGDYNERNYPLSLPYNRKKLLDSVDEIYLSNLRLFLDHITEPILLGRIYEILWLKSKKKSKLDAENAIDQYIQVKINPQNFFLATKYCLARAFIYIKMFKREQSLTLLEDKLKALMSLHKSDLEFYLHLLKFCHEFSIFRSDDQSTAKLCRNIFEDCMKEKRFDLAKRYIGLAEDKFRLLNDSKSKSKMLELSGDAWLEEAKSRSSDTKFVLSSLFSNAIQTYLKIPKSHRTSLINDKIEECKKLRQDTSETTFDEMPVFSHEQDVSDLALDARDRVSGKDTPQVAIGSLCSFPIALNVHQLIELVEQSRANFPLSSLMSNVYLSSDGRVVGHSSAIALDESVTSENITNFANFNLIASSNIGVMVQGMILPAVRQITEEFLIDQSLMLELCEQAPLVESGRYQIISKALLAGFNLEFDVAVHLLIPQIEHFVRSSLRENDKLVHTSEPDHTAEVSSLNFLLHEPMAKEVFDESLLFELKVLFANETSFNFRNRLAHGLCDDSDSYSSESIYIWWRYLRLVLGSLALSTPPSD